ncbi:MAG: histidinol dehydrogenase, partial [Solirubrobacterales bacterium]|nr:histidinol dehydrogenase [Solirubrobacterales bacterium]
MRIRTQSWDGGDPAAFAASLRAAISEPEGLRAAVAETIERVRRDGDSAVAELSERFDGIAADPVEVPGARLSEAVGEIPAELRRAIEESAGNVRAVAEAQIGEPVTVEPGAGQVVEVAEVPVGAAAVYVPGGRAPYPSSVVMGVVPAAAAGVGRIVVASPPDAGSGEPPPAVLAAAAIAGADAVYAVGGAQAIAALAYGTESIPAVDVIAGPGSPWVQEAKLQCSRAVGIDGYAGPSELVALVAADVPCEWIALDLCAQAEHGDDGLLVAIGTDPTWLERLAAEIERVQARRPDPGDATFELVSAVDLEAGIALTEALAPEHTEIVAPGAR